MLPDRMSRLRLAPRQRRPEGRGQDLATATRRVQRAKTMGDLLKSIITGILVASSAR